MTLLTLFWKRYAFIILILYLLIGWIWPKFGIVALLCMLAPPIAVAFFKGKTWCGLYCPRGSLWDAVFTRMNRRKHAPQWAKSTLLRILVLIVIFLAVGWQMYYAWPDSSKIGSIFYKLILITTLVGVCLALIYSPRTWCHFCPMGTLSAWLSAGKKPLSVANCCIECNLCSQNCPMGLTPSKAKGSSYSDPDCLKCGECINSCPQKALSFNLKRNLK
jgi:ferredoxin-type protein NapH